MLTPEVVKQALATSHDECVKGCVHAEAVAHNFEAAMETINRVTAAFAGDPVEDLLYALWYAGYHDGYRSHQLESQLPYCTPKEKVN